MNEVVCNFSIKEEILFDAKTREYYLDNGVTAFIGAIGSSSEKHAGLFLITYDAVVKAEDPMVTWNEAFFTVEKFVNIKISIVS